MQSEACGLKFYGALAIVACVILVLAASRVMFHGLCVPNNFISGLPVSNNTLPSFSGAKDSSPIRFQFMIVLHLVVNIVETMLKKIFFCVIVTIFKFTVIQLSRNIIQIKTII